MSRLFAGLVAACVVLAGGVKADDIKPGELHLVVVKEAKKDVSAKAGDVIEFRIQDPALPQMIVMKDVKVGGDLKKAGVVRVTPKGIVGGDYIAVLVSAEKKGKGTVKITFTDNDKDKTKVEKEFKVEVK